MLKKIYLSVFVIIALYGVLLIPDNAAIPIEEEGNAVPFIWDKDDKWDELEEQFTQYTRLERDSLNLQIEYYLQESRDLLDQIDSTSIANDQELGHFLNSYFELSTRIAASKEIHPNYLEMYNDARRKIKQASINWDLSQHSQRELIYQMLYGMRAAVEEVLLQSYDAIDPVLHVQDEPSETPSTQVLGIKVHSGDLLVSRGGAEVSALISRGNDYPGNFSHVALIYIEEGTNIPYFIEAHIERGVAIARLDEYINDRKLRFMVVRPRADLEALQEDPMLPHKAAKWIFEEVQNRHIPYDFKMNFYDDEAMFCSEVGSTAYAKYGIQLWENESTLSSTGVVSLLNTFGVEYFRTQMPSDLEYDSQLSVVAEWRSNESLWDDHVYNAVIDAMLMCASQGDKVEHNPFMLPVARVIKGYSWLMNRFGKASIIPEGMSATQALKNNTFVEEHKTIKEKVLLESETFYQEKGYKPPYWELVRMAEKYASCSVN
ncbi:YiiX/YebB-like N1pC/P60 family cysteine hydrolase [Balneola vulgaris]|uniref:YiiX/YebB-like N1pC/P60 family cysteine hydrolase n=1 Tax=Balneola vulgaris TaxID=287535 RepID=UPI00036B3CBA|nr:YiiX/YebB-like N1pC/P60 family cysteine hydrolase [Balneola vulgaris]